jgi:thiamine-phosphate diphosphorylase
VSTTTVLPPTINELLPVLMLVTDTAHLRGRRLRDVVSAAIDGGVTVVQVRQASSPVRVDRRSRFRMPKWLSGMDPDMAALTEEVSVATDERALVSVNGDVGVALSYGAALHLPERHGRTVSQERANPSLAVVPISRSVHSVAAAVAAEAEGADFLVFGTVFPSPSHPGGPTIGLDGVRAVCDAVSIPVIGIGGITAKDAGDVIRAGASGVAVISAIFDADDPRAAAAELRAAIDAAWTERPPQ